MEHIDYEAILRPALRFFYLQRCGCAIPEAMGGQFAHAACHTALAEVYGSTASLDVSGGWHDAGDYGRYTAPGAKAAADLLLSYLAAPTAFTDDTGIPESGNGVPDILDEARYELNWLLKMQRDDGGVYHKVSCRSFCGFISPDAETEPLVISPVSTAATGDFAGCMALAYTVYRAFDFMFAVRCLAASARAYAFLKQSPPLPFRNPPEIVTGEYDDDCDADERFFAAASLHAATGEGDYAQDALNLLRSGFPLSLGWADMGGYGALCCLRWGSACVKPLYTALHTALIAKAGQLLTCSQCDPYGSSLNGEYLWGSNMYLLNNAILLCEAHRLSGDGRYLSAARRHLDYVLGSNPLSMCYLTGHCERSPRHPHHRPSVAAGTAMPGMLVGGPDAGLHDPCAKAHLTGRPAAQCYIDDSESYSTNEVAIYWNSPLIYLVALLTANP